MSATTIADAEARTGRGTCIVCARQMFDPYRVIVVARPAALTGGYAQFTTPHKVCVGHANLIGVRVEDVARFPERVLLIDRARTEQGWRDVVLSLTTERIITSGSDR